MQKILSYISSDLFSKDSIFNYETGKTVQTLKIKKRTKNSWGSYVENDISIGELIKDQFNSRIKEELAKKIEEIIKTADYKEKVEEIANELIDYTVNGYKEDMKNRIRERLIGNVMDESATYCGMSITDIINQEIDRRLYGNR